MLYDHSSYTFIITSIIRCPRVLYTKDLPSEAILYHCYNSKVHYPGLQTAADSLPVGIPRLQCQYIRQLQILKKNLAT